MHISYPSEFYANGWNIGLKPKGPDFGALYSSRICNAAAVFTRNVFPGHPVIVGRDHIRDGKLQAIIVNSANANVATGPQGLELAKKCCQEAGKSLGIRADLVLPSSTGVIARPLPENPMLNACRELKAKLTKPNFLKFSNAMMTTDAFRKFRSVELESKIVITGMAKGAGMIQPDMATMLCYILTDADIESSHLDRLLKILVNKTFNRISVDSDTSTSDTVVLMANGASAKKLSFSDTSLDQLNDMNYPLEHEKLQSVFESPAELEFVEVLMEIMTSLAKLVAADGEGATKLIELTIKGAIDNQQAITTGRSVINSPLIKTAVYGADPNWGRLLMALGKTQDQRLDLNKIRIFFGDFELKGLQQTEKELRILSNYLKNHEVDIIIDLGLGHKQETFWGCDLTEEYVKLNSMYTT